MSFLMERKLPKWPQMLVTGAPVTEEQALEIIRRTDAFFLWGNGSDRVFAEATHAAIGYPPDPPYYNCEKWAIEDGKIDQRAYSAAVMEYQEAEAAWRKAWGCLDVEYAYNSWVSSSYIAGPDGWCHPDGSIRYCGTVGSKWPTVQALYNEWLLIAGEFPFLEAEITMVDGSFEEKGAEPIVSFLVRNGSVMLVDPNEHNIHEEFGRAIPVETEEEHEQRVERVVTGGLEVMHAIPMEQVEAWGREFKEGR